MYRQNGDLANLLKSAQKKSAPECPFEWGGGVQSLFGQCPNRGDAKFGGVSLTKTRYMLFRFILHVLEYCFVFFNKFYKMINFYIIGL